MSKMIYKLFILASFSIMASAPAWAGTIFQNFEPDNGSSPIITPVLNPTRVTTP